MRLSASAGSFFDFFRFMKRIFVAILFVVSLGAVTAQTVDQQAEIDALNQRIAKLEKRAQVWDKIKPALQLSGYLQAGYDLLWDKEGTQTSSLHLRRARMTLQGDIYKGEKGAKASYRLQVDLCKSPVILDLWAKFQPVNQFGVQIGQFKVPISIENTDYNATRLEFISYAQTVQAMSRNGSSDMTGINSSGRDIGVQFAGGFIKKDGFSLINYEVGVFNGAGINIKDNNKSKDVAARFTVQPLKKLKIAAYYLQGEAVITSLVDKYPAMAEGWNNLNYVTYNRYGGGVDYSNDYLFARSEVIAGDTGECSSAGVYAQVGYKLRDKFSVGIRYDYFDPDVNTSALQQTAYTVALSYLPWKHLRLQAEYTLKQYAKASQKPVTNCVYFMATAMF